MKKNKESQRSAKRDLVKCFYDDATLPAGDVQGNDNQGPKGQWAVASRVAGEKKLPNGAFRA